MKTRGKTKRNTNINNINKENINSQAYTVFIPGYEGRYLIYNNGDVYSVKSKRCLKPRIRGKKNPYLFVSLWKNNREKHYYIHRLIAGAFIDNLNNKPFINHIDGDMMNNHVSNLEWCTQSENVQHAVSIGKIKQGYGSPNSKFTKKQIQYIRATYPSLNQYELAKKFNVAQGTIQTILANKRYID
tara:strand:+ start:2754 stop:3311 length:558 start_codon:yes stop_codon:yes gene_type:complete